MCLTGGLSWTRFGSTQKCWCRYDAPSASSGPQRCSDHNGQDEELGLFALTEQPRGRKSASLKARRCRFSFQDPVLPPLPHPLKQRSRRVGTRACESLAGNSLGGGVATCMALQRPTYFRGVPDLGSVTSSPDLGRMSELLVGSGSPDGSHVDHQRRGEAALDRTDDLQAPHLTVAP